MDATILEQLRADVERGYDATMTAIYKAWGGKVAPDVLRLEILRAVTNRVCDRSIEVVERGADARRRLNEVRRAIRKTGTAADDAKA